MEEKIFNRSSDIRIYQLGCQKLNKYKLLVSYQKKLLQNTKSQDVTQNWRYSHFKQFLHLLSPLHYPVMHHQFKTMKRKGKGLRHRWVVYCKLLQQPLSILSLRHLYNFTLQKGKRSLFRPPGILGLLTVSGIFGN